MPNLRSFDGTRYIWERKGESYEVEREPDGTLAFYAGVPEDGVPRAAQRAEPGDEVLAELLDLADAWRSAESKIIDMKRPVRSETI